MKRVGVAVALALVVLAVCWRLWTPIHGAARVLPGGWLVVAQLWLLGWGTALWLARGGAPAAAAIGAGALAVLTSPLSAAAPAAAPFLLLAVDAWRERASAREAGLLAVACAAALLFPSGLGDTLLVAGPYAIAAWGRRALLPVALVAAAGAVQVVLLDRTFQILIAPPPYPGAVVILAALLALWLRRGARTVVLAVLAAGGSGLALAALLAEGLGAALATDRRDTAGRVLLAIGLAGGVALGCAAAATTGAGKATPLHDALLVAFLAWVPAAFVVRQIAVAPARWRGAFLACAAFFACAEVWYAQNPRLDATFVRGNP
jgi:hypothetical protein